jgi:hypothetical protein
MDGGDDKTYPSLHTVVFISSLVCYPVQRSSDCCCVVVTNNVHGEKKMAGQVEEMRKVHWRVSGETQRWSIYGTSFPDFGVS